MRCPVLFIRHSGDRSIHPRPRAACNNDRATTKCSALPLRKRIGTKNNFQMLRAYTVRTIPLNSPSLLSPLSRCKLLYLTRIYSVIFTSDRRDAQHHNDHATRNDRGELLLRIERLAFALKVPLGISLPFFLSSLLSLSSSRTESRYPTHRALVTAFAQDYPLNVYIY